MIEKKVASPTSVNAVVADAGAATTPTEVSSDPMNRAPQPCSRKPAIDLCRLRDRLDDIPDLRWNKVIELRRTIQAKRYDAESLLDGVLPRVENEVGVLCRRENLPDDDPLVTRAGFRK